MFHGQFALVYREHMRHGKTGGGQVQDDEGRINHVLRITPALGCAANGDGGGEAPAFVGGVEARAARIISFAELLLFFGEDYTAAELHTYWCNARRLSVRQAHAWTNPTRRSAQQAHHKAAWRYSLGSGVGVGETAMSGTVPKGEGTGKGKGKKR